MQWKQLRHDENYHKEIWLLTVQQRITHMTLHLSKYSAKITISAFEDDTDTLRKTTIDALIISFSSANIFSVPLSKFALSDENRNLSNINELSENLFKPYKSANKNISTQLSLEILRNTGMLCKFVESLDHLETLDYRGKILESLAAVFRLLLALCYCMDIKDIENKISDRLYTLESKNIFFNMLGNYQKGY